MYNFHPYIVLLAIATDIPVLGFVLQGHVWFFTVLRRDTAGGKNTVFHAPVTCEILGFLVGFFSY